MKVLMFVFVFFVFSGLVIISNNDLALIKDSNMLLFFDLYLSWLDHIYSNIQSLTGYALKLNWVSN
jgi:hypothetical protein|tara:strand:- start:390 stop:587 length:198 start_codon:yes stop_codon:yes gene_type:complete